MSFGQKKGMRNMYEIKGLLDQLRFTFDEKNKRWEIYYTLDFTHGSLKDVSLLGVVVVYLSEHGEVTNIKAYDQFDDNEQHDELDYPEEFVQCAKNNEYVQERIQSSQHIIKELNRLNTLTSVGKIKNFTYDYELGIGEMYLEHTDLCFVFGWKNTNKLRFLSVEYSIDGLKDSYSGSYLNITDENGLQPVILQEIENEINKRIRIRGIFEK